MRDWSGVPPYFGGTRAESPTRGTRGTPEKKEVCSKQFAVSGKKVRSMKGEDLKN